MAAAAGLESQRRRGRRAALPRPVSDSLTLPGWQQTRSVANVAVATRHRRNETTLRARLFTSSHPTTTACRGESTRACVRASGPSERSRAVERWQESCLTVLKWCRSTVVMGGRLACAVRDATPRIGRRAWQSGTCRRMVHRTRNGEPMYVAGGFSALMATRRALDKRDGDLPER